MRNCWPILPKISTSKHYPPQPTAPVGQWKIDRCAKEKALDRWNEFPALQRVPDATSTSWAAVFRVIRLSLAQLSGDRSGNASRCDLLDTTAVFFTCKTVRYSVNLGTPIFTTGCAILLIDLFRLML